MNMKSPNVPTPSSRRGLKICGGAPALALIVVAAVFVTLLFTLFQPKDPEITARPVGLENIMNLSVFPINNVTLNMSITIDNKRNYGSFKFKNGTAYVNYRGGVVAEVPVGHNLVPARGKIDINATTDLMVGKMLSNPEFFDDFIAGSLNLTSTASFRGRMNLFNILKRRATAFSDCEISVFVASGEVQSKCKTKIKL